VLRLDPKSFDFVDPFWSQGENLLLRREIEEIMTGRGSRGRGRGVGVERKPGLRDQAGGIRISL
jgi:hypothetical protein